MPPAQDEDIGQLGQRDAALPQSGSPCQQHGLLFKQRSQDLTKLWYTRHRSAPVRPESTDIPGSGFSQSPFFVKLILSALPNLTPMGQPLCCPSALLPSPHGYFFDKASRSMLLFAMAFINIGMPSIN